MTALLSTSNRFMINVSSGTNGITASFNPLETYTWTIATFGSITNFSPSQFSIATSATNGTVGVMASNLGSFSVIRSNNALQLNYKANTNAPNWTPPTGMRYSALIYARVLDLNGSPITNSGSMLAVFNGGSIAGLASPSAGPNGTTLYQLNVPKV